jgi:hypothetical protein
MVVATVVTTALLGSPKGTTAAGATSSATSAALGTAKPRPTTSAPAASHKAAPSQAAASQKAASTAAPTAVATPASAAVATTAPAESSQAPQSTAATAKAAPAPATVTLPQPAGRWALSDADAPGTAAGTAADSAGAHPAAGSNVSWCTAVANGNCATFDGKAAGFETIVSQDGTDDSGFYLQYVGATNQWAFSRVTGDTNAGPAGIRAYSTTAVLAVNTWTELVGVFDASDDQLRLYVNGVLQGTATDSSPFAASGDLAIGRAQFDGAPTDWLDGAVNQVRAWNVALTTAQVDQI